MLFKTKIIAEFEAFVVYPVTLKQSSVGSPEGSGVQARERGWFRGGPWSDGDASRNGSVPWDTLHQLLVILAHWQHFSVAQKPAGTPELVQTSLVSRHQHLPELLYFWKLSSQQHFPSKRKSFTSHPASTSPTATCLWAALGCPAFWRQGESNTCSSAHLNTSQSVSLHLN